MARFYLKFLSSLLVLSFSLSLISSSVLWAEVISRPASASPDGARFQKLEDISKIKDKLMASVVANKDPEAEDSKIANINALLGIEEGLLKEGKIHHMEDMAVTPEEKEAVIREANKEAVFLLKEVQFSGNTSIASKKLAPLVKKYLNHDINFEAVQEIASDVKKYYREKGYLAAYIYAPPQNMKSGTLQLTVMEGKLGQLQIEGNKWVSTQTIKKQLSIKPNQVINYDTFRSDLDRLNKNRDIHANIVLKPGATQGTTDVKLQVKDEHPWHVSVDANNLGTRNTGRYRGGATLSHTNLTGRMDQLTARGQLGKDAWAMSTDYNVPINSMGTRIGGSYSHAFNEVGGDFKILGIEGDADTYSIYALHPIYSRPNFETTFKLGFDWKSVQNRILGFDSGNDELRILNTGFNIEQKDAYGQTFSPHSFNFGLDALGASSQGDDDTTAIGTGGDFFVYRGSFIRHQRVIDGVWLLLRGTTQLTNDHLPPVEQMRLGGAYTVRGYQEGEFLGDYGANGSAELQFAFKIFPETWKFPFTNEPLNKAVEWVAFFDAGWAQSHDPILGEKLNRELMGAGTGLRLHIADKYYARFEWAAPLGDNDRAADHRDSAFYFGISAELF